MRRPARYYVEILAGGARPGRFAKPPSWPVLPCFSFNFVVRVSRYFALDILLSSPPYDAFRPLLPRARAWTMKIIPDFGMVLGVEAQPYTGP